MKFLFFKVIKIKIIIFIDNGKYYGNGILYFFGNMLLIYYVIIKYMLLELSNMSMEFNSEKLLFIVVGLVKLFYCVL